MTYAQESFVSGRVTSNGEALIGVSIIVKNKPDLGTITDQNGNYRLRVSGNETLTFSFVGYATVNESINNRKTINVNLNELSISLDELVITVPYGTVKKSTFTGSAGYVGSNLIEQSQVSNVSKALQGTVAGLQSFSQSGQPGSDATVRIRGIGSVNASSAPLYIVDGAPYDGELSSIASSDIESITVLKDAASATLYGSRAANGVIMITTKQGKKEIPTVEVTSKFGFSNRAIRDYDQVNTSQYFELFWEALRNNRLDNGDTREQAAAYASANLAGRLGINPYGTGNPEPVGYDGKVKAGLAPLWDDSWIDALSQNAHYTDINTQISGGSNNSRYFLSAGYLNDQGMAIESGFKRYTLRANLISDIRKWLQVGANISGTHSIQDYPKQDDTMTSNVIYAARMLPSFYPVYERNLATGEYLINPETGQYIADYGAYRATSFSKQNLMESMPHDIHQIKRDAASIRGYIQIEPFEGLSLKSSLNIDYNSRFNHDYTNPLYGEGATSGGGVSKSNSRTVGTTINNVLNYSIKINKIHSLRLLAGHEYYEYNSSNFSGSREKVIMDGFYEPSAASLVSGFSGSSDQYKLLSFFGNAEYSLKDRYYLSASVRSDGSSRFHPDNRWGTFWSVGGSWRISEEPFLAKTKKDWLSKLTLRTSYGAQGNDNISYYAYQALYSIRNNLGESGLLASRLATPNLSWETNLNLNIGLDFGLFNNRIDGSVEYFERRSRDLLFSKSLVPSSGFSSTSENIGAIKNYGWELTLGGYPISTENWKWKLSVNATTYKNEITSLPSPVMWSGQKKWVIGGSLYDFYLVEWAGVNPETGDAQWYHYNGNGEKVITEDYSSLVTDDKIKSGSSLPDISGGFQSDLSFKGFELSTQFAYVLGGKIYNRDNLSLQHQGSAGNPWSTTMLGRWTPENPNTDIPRLTTTPKSSWTSESNRFLIDRSYLRFKTATLSYTLPTSWLKSLTVKSGSIFVQAENLFTLTKEQGIDPEQTFDGTTYFRYPTMKTVSFGFNVKL
jgi:TonB-linked SusC/RagA family outer membrane protein